ncbi:MAG: hypothetical protein M1837_006149 [Sclerophora amabilis]|nr:MAG: hypothetical protein M1837_006149 [Sclerophora amabilis]
MGSPESTPAAQTSPRSSSSNLGHEHKDPDEETSSASIPPPPDPASDPGIFPSTQASSQDDGSGLSNLSSAPEIDIFQLSPIAALKLMCTRIDALAKITGDVPPTPPVSVPNTPNLNDGQAGEEEPMGSRSNQRAKERKPRPSSLVVTPDDITSVELQKTPVGSPEAAESEPVPAVAARPEPMSVQHGAIIRKFYSKKPPPIPLQDYLLRIHRYCPMSTAVYLATSLYIHRLAVVERILPVTGRNVHRLLLGGLRVAMKALEDLNYPHKRFATVGGVSEPELARLEISFCFVSNFDFKVDEDDLLKQAKSLKDFVIPQSLTNFEPKMPSFRDKSRSAPAHGSSILSVVDS